MRQWAYAGLASVGLCLYYFEKDDALFKNSMLNVLLLLFFYLGINAITKIDIQARIRRFSHYTAIGAAVIFMIGHSVSVDNRIGHLFGRVKEESGAIGWSFWLFVSHIVTTAALYLIFEYTARIIFHFISERSVDIFTGKEPVWFTSNRRSLFYLWGAIFLCWLPAYIAYYPGTFCYDIHGQWSQTVSGSYDRFQLVTHTFFFGAIRNLAIAITGGGGSEDSPAEFPLTMVLYSFIQMLLLSLIFAFAVWYMAKIKLHPGFRVAAFGYFALNPINAMFSFTPTKDVLFAGLMVLLCVCLAELARDPEHFFSTPKLWAGTGAVAVLFGLFRNNAIYALLLTVIVLVLIYRRYLLRASLIFGGCLVLYYFINGPIYNALGVGPGQFKESFSVPLHQLDTVYQYHKDTLVAKCL